MLDLWILLILIKSRICSKHSAISLPAAVVWSEVNVGVLIPGDTTHGTTGSNSTVVLRRVRLEVIASIDDGGDVGSAVAWCGGWWMGYDSRGVTHRSTRSSNRSTRSSNRNTRLRHAFGRMAACSDDGTTNAVEGRSAYAAQQSQQSKPQQSADHSSYDCACEVNSQFKNCHLEFVWSFETEKILNIS